MAEHGTQALALYPGWDAYQDLLAQTVAPLTAEQIALRAAPHLRSIGENCRHIIGARARWCLFGLGISDETLTAFAEWDNTNMPERSAAELVSGLRKSWHVLRDALASMTPADLDRTVPNTDPEPVPGEPEAFTVGWIIWHLIEHDVFHGGEISLILGANGLTGLDL